MVSSELADALLAAVKPCAFFSGRFSSTEFDFLISIAFAGTLNVSPIFNRYKITNSGKTVVVLP